MVEVGLADATLRAVDRVGHELAIDVVGWDDDAAAEPIPVKGLDEFVAARASQLTFGDELVELGDASADGFEKLSEDRTTVDLADETHVLKVTAQVGAYAKFSGAGTLARLADGRVRLSFAHPTAVTVGYWSLVDYPEETVTVPPTASGLATALSTLSSAYLSMCADPGRLQELLENLVRNSVEHGASADEREVDDASRTAEGSGDALSVTVGALADDAGFFVADDGVGIPAGDRESVMERGYSTASDGTGFGLGIVAEIGRAHGWSVTVTESADGGARFEIRTASA